MFIQVYCPIATCGVPIETEGNGMAECWKCSHLFCTLCSRPYHGTTDCELNDEERTNNARKVRDEEVAEQLLLEESQNQLLFEQFEREEVEWLERIREEQEEIRRMEQIEKEEEEIRAEEQRRLEEEQRRADEERRREEEYQRMVRENEEREQRQQAKLAERRREEQASEATVEQTTKKCPNCKSPIEVSAY